jgi:hypothetical protein
VISNEVKKLMSEAANDYATAEAASGEGWQENWPEPGDYDAYVTSVTFAPGTFRQTDKREYRCIDVHFDYEIIPRLDDPTADPEAAPVTFSGLRMQLVPRYESTLTDDGGKIRARLDLERFKGMVSGLLGKPPAECGDFEANSDAISALLDEQGKVPVQLRIVSQRRKGRDTPILKDVIRGLLT